VTERRLLILGGSGQLGCELRALHWPGGVTLAAPPHGSLDLADRAAVAATLAAEPWTAVINAAGWTAVDAAEDAVADAFAANALGPAILAEETRRHGVPLIHVSTDYVFDGTRPAAYVEDDPARPLGVYGASKLAGEEAVRTGNPRHVIVRTAWLFSRFGRNFVKSMLAAARERNTVRVVDDQVGTPTAAADLAAALARIALTADLGDRAGLYHFANSGETTWCGFARRIFALSRARGGPTAAVEAIATGDYPSRARRPANSRLSTAKIEEVFGLAPRPWEAGLTEVIDALLGAADGPPFAPAAR
jgi:dTDP-4-dehydrorhamnose reductase